MDEAAPLDYVALLTALTRLTEAMKTGGQQRDNQMNQFVGIINAQQQGRADEDAQDFVDQINRIADLEEWNAENRLLVAATHLLDTAAQWHSQTGNNYATWQLWSQALVVPLPDADIIKMLLRGLRNPIHVEVLTSPLPAVFPTFLTRLRELKQLGLPSMGLQVPTSTLPSAQSLHLVNPTFHTAPPLTVVLDIEKVFVNFGDKLINQLSASISRLQIGPATNVAPRGGGTKATSAFPSIKKRLDRPTGAMASLNEYFCLKHRPALPLIKVWLEYIGEVIALVDSGAIVSAVRLSVVRKFLKPDIRILMGKLKGVDNKVVKIQGTVQVNVKWKGILVELNTVTVLRKAPFAFILGTDWIVKSKASLIVKDNRIEIIGDEEASEGKQEVKSEERIKTTEEED
ncbi:Uncharacterized protein APZ42_025041 [Daphnia magna]|uniref:Peptidase A2 domain-containing protein n=1 Tax=Daphnia magna TaxID=35525 RepID=A0A164TIM4_9CRUS|nr:Uncharacterized protein APZ42_025041 [Daphnia magna]